MLRAKFLFFENIFGIYFLLQILIPHHFPFLTTFTGFILLFINKYLFEGFRLTSFIIILTQLTLFNTKSIYIGLPLIFILYAGLAYFPIYKYPDPTGKYRVGYRRFVIPGVTSVGVYYPTQERTKDVKYSPDHFSWRRFADLMIFYAEIGKRRKLPRILFKIALSFLEHQYLGVNENARIVNAERENKKFPVVAFSHGLSANIHLYSVQTKEWASNGFVVFSIDHEEEIYLNPKNYKTSDDFMKERSKQLNTRKNTARKVLDLISDANYVQKLFGEQELALDYNKVFFAGHSFGGASMAELAGEDKRATAGVLLLDPWLEACNTSILYKPLNKPLLSLRSHAFERWRVGESIAKHAKVNAKMGLSGYFQDSVHNSSTDLLLLLPRELVIFGKIKGMKNIENEIRNHSLLTKEFLLTALDYKEKSKPQGTLKLAVLENFRKELEKSGRDDILIVDD